MSKVRVAPTADEVVAILSEHFELNDHVVRFDHAANLLRARLRTTNDRARKWLLAATEEKGSPLLQLQTHSGGHLGGVRKINRRDGHWYGGVEEGRPVLFTPGEMLGIRADGEQDATMHLRINPDGSFFDAPSWRVKPEDRGLAEKDTKLIMLTSTLERFMERARQVRDRQRTEHEAENIVHGEAVEVHMGEDYRTIKAFLDTVFVDSRRSLRGSPPSGKGDALDYSSVNISLYDGDIARFAEGLRKLGITPEPRP